MATDIVSVVVVGLSLLLLGIVSAVGYSQHYYYYNYFYCCYYYYCYYCYSSMGL